MTRRKRAQSGAVTVEYALAYVAVIVPLTFGIIFTAQLLWIWHSASEWTRQAGRYAATHCWQASGDNVASFMRSNVPAMVDGDQFRDGAVDIAITYYSKDPDTGAPAEFSCDNECSTQCVPEAVTIRVRNYEYRTFVQYLGMAPIRMPEFQTSVPMESAGCDPEQGICNP